MGSASLTLSALGIRIPAIAAPMAGGPSTPALVVAAAAAGSIGLLAGGYKTPQVLADQTTASFGVNLFAPNPVPAAPEAYRTYARTIQPEADKYGVTLPTDAPIEDDDAWDAKIDLLLADPVPIVSFTFGIPSTATIAALRRAGSVVVQTVTSVDEARAAAEAGADLLAVQASAAGGHSGTLTPERIPAALPLTELLASVRAAVSLPLIAAGGLSSSEDVAGVLRAGAVAAMVGTVLLRADESGASAPYKSALADPLRRTTVVTRAFTGRPARALRNTFVDRYDSMAIAGYPAVHHLTSPLRKAAAAAGNPELINLWAGTGYRHATPEPVGTILTRLTAAL
jgi:nitronate monooxygenase